VTLGARRLRPVQSSIKPNFPRMFFLCGGWELAQKAPIGFE
jgi:hypothetical protein